MPNLWPVFWPICLVRKRLGLRSLVVASPRLVEVRHCLDVVGQDYLPGLRLTREHRLDGLAEQSRAKRRVFRDVPSHKLSEIPCQCKRSVKDACR